MPESLRWTPLERMMELRLAARVLQAVGARGLSIPKRMMLGPGSGPEDRQREMFGKLLIAGPYRVGAVLEVQRQADTKGRRDCVDRYASIAFIG